MKGMEHVPQKKLESTEDIEALSSAAVLYDGELFTGENHGQIREEIVEKYRTFDYALVKEGFRTTDGRFVERKEATGIARNAGQLKYEPLDGKLRSNEISRYKEPVSRQILIDYGER